MALSPCGEFTPTALGPPFPPFLGGIRRWSRTGILTGNGVNFKSEAVASVVETVRNRLLLFPEGPMQEAPPIQKRDPSTPIPGLPGTKLVDYWSWAYSDVLSNVNRSVFAEFLVARALVLDVKPRVEWDAYDLLYGNTRIEVKAGGRLQSWKQTSLSPIQFDIAAKRSWSSTTGESSKEPVRSSDVYVFCVHFEEVRDRCDPLDCGQWEFYVVPSSQIRQVFGNQKSVSLSTLKQRTGCKSARIAELKVTIDSTVA
jgi:hypothetical protein